MLTNTTAVPDAGAESQRNRRATREPSMGVVLAWDLALASLRRQGFG
jgi:hypothetical protein